MFTASPLPSGSPVCWTAGQPGEAAAPHAGAEAAPLNERSAAADGLIDQAKTTLDVRLPDVGAARENAWKNAEHVWNLPPVLVSGLLDTIDGFTTVIGKTLLVPVP